MNIRRAFVQARSCDVDESEAIRSATASELGQIHFAFKSTQSKFTRLANRALLFMRSWMIVAGYTSHDMKFQ